MVDNAILTAIMNADPDGGSIEPTEAMYAAHKAWAIERFGIAAWNAYNTPGWGDGAYDDEPRHVEY